MEAVFVITLLVTLLLLKIAAWREIVRGPDAPRQARRGHRQRPLDVGSPDRGRVVDLERWFVPDVVPGRRSRSR